MVSGDYYNTAQRIHVALCIIGEHVLINYFLFQTWYPNSKPYPFLQHCQHDVSIFSQGKRTIPDLCQDIMKYFHDGSFTKKQQWAIPRNKETIGVEETLTPAFPDPNEPSYGSEIQLAHFCLFSFPFHASMHLQLDWLWKEKYITRKLALVFPFWSQPLWERLRQSHECRVSYLSPPSSNLKRLTISY